MKYTANVRSKWFITLEWMDVNLQAYRCCEDVPLSIHHTFVLNKSFTKTNMYINVFV